MSAPDVLIVDDVDAFADACAARVVEACRGAIAARGRFAIALTGGSTPVPMHRALARAPHRDAIDWARVDVFFGDERAVPPADPRSNYRAAREALLDHVPVPTAQVHRIEAERDDLHAVAREYEATLRRACGGALDLLVVGLGKDAHVLSLWPGSDLVLERDALVVASIDPPMDPPLSRVTLTPAAVEAARSVLAIATSASKRDAVERALHGDDDPRAVPAHVLRRARTVRFVIDRAAAPPLSRL